MTFVINCVNSDRRNGRWKVNLAKWECHRSGDWSWRDYIGGASASKFAAEDLAMLAGRQWRGSLLAIVFGASDAWTFEQKIHLVGEKW